MASAQAASPGPDSTSAALVERLGSRVDPDLLERALVHRSYSYENGGLPTNERLEFLGDSVLGLVVTDRLYTDHPDLPEGQLAKLRAAVVNQKALASVARELKVGAHVYLGRGEQTTGGRDKDSILADTLEALIGAVYLTDGIDAARSLVERLLARLLLECAGQGPALDWKTSLQELTSASSIGIPEYRVSEEGPDHEKTFTAVVVVGDEELGQGVGRSKKQAEQQAAEHAWTELRGREEAAAAALLESEISDAGTTVADDPSAPE